MDALELQEEPSRRKSPRANRQQILALLEAAAHRDHDRVRRAALQIAATLGEPHSTRIQRMLAVEPDLPPEASKLWSARRAQDRPWYPAALETQIARLLEDLQYRDALVAEGVDPLVRVLLCGPPGCGKTMTAAWLGAALGVQTRVMELGEIIHSFMGQTSASIVLALRAIADVPGVWVLDELDAIAQRRSSDVAGAGKEYNSVVNALCVALDTLGIIPGGFLVATTNRLEAIDPAVVRRFDVVLQWPAPTGQLLAAFSVALDYDGCATTYADVVTGAARQKRERAIARIKAAVKP